jgi:hypothetical protein
MPSQCSADNDLLLIPSTQLHDLLIEAACDNTQLFYQVGRNPVAARARNDSQAR